MPHLSILSKRLYFETIVSSDPDADSRPAIVFLHEGLGSVSSWKTFPAECCAVLGCHGLIHDRPGYGRSDPDAMHRDATYLRDEAERWLPAVLRAVGITRPILVGHSDGGTIALAHAALHPDAVTAVVSEAAHVFIEDVTLAGIRRAVDAYEHGGLRAKLERQHGDKTDTVFHGWADTWLSPGHAGWNMGALLPAIRCPVLALQGVDDEYGSPEQVRRIIDGVQGPSRGVLLPDCGHIPHHQAREAVLDAVKDFLDQAGVLLPDRFQSR